MDQAELQKNIALYYSKLPPKAQEMFGKMLWLEELKKIGIKYALNGEQIKTLGTETTLVLLGMVHMMEYEQNLINELVMPKQDMEEMIQDIKDNILKPIIPELVEAYKKNTETDSSETIEQEKTAEDLGPKFQKLPNEFRDAIIKSNYHDNLYKIGQEYKLNIIQMGKLEETLSSMMVGNIHTEKLEENLKDKVGISSEAAGKLANDLNEKILKKIREKMVGSSEIKNSPQSIKPAMLDKIELEPPKIQKREESILNTAGIQINDPVLKEFKPLSPEDKLTNTFKIPTIETEHTLGNISKAPEAAAIEKTSPTASPKAPIVAPKTPEIPIVVSPKVMNDIKPATSVPAKAPATNYKDKDPYRMSPDE